MKPDERLDRIFEAARGASPDIGRVEVGLEVRVLARVREARSERSRPWSAWTWRLVPLFTAATLAVGLWYYVSTPDNPTDMRSVITAEYSEYLAQNFTTGE